MGEVLPFRRRRRAAPNTPVARDVLKWHLYVREGLDRVAACDRTIITPNVGHAGDVDPAELCGRCFP